MANTFNIQLSTPVMTAEKWAETIGKEVSKVKRSMSEGKTPFIQDQKGGERLVNVLEIALKAASQSNFNIRGL